MLKVIKLATCALLAMTLFYPSLSYAKNSGNNGNSCSVLGNKDFVIEMQVTGSSDYQELYFTQGTKREETVWYTQDYKSNSSYIFNEPNLNLGQTYEIRIEHDSSRSNEYNLYYYRRDLGQTDWVLLASSDSDIKNGNLSGEGNDIDSVSCSQDTVVPPEPPVFPEQCTFSPYAVQGWEASNATLTFTGDGNIYGTRSSQGKVGYDQVIKDWAEQKACDGKACEADAALLIASPAVESVFTTSQSLTLEWNDIPEEITGNNYQTVTVEDGTYIFPNSEYQIGELILLDDAVVIFPNKTWLKVNKLTMSDDSKFVTKDDDSSNLLIWAENSSGELAQVDISEGTQPINAVIFSRDSVKLSGTSSVIGSVTSRYIEMDGSSKIDATGIDCSTPAVIERIEIKPYNYHLTCETGDDQLVEVHVLDSDGNYVSGYQPSLVQENGSNLTINFESLADGIAKYRVSTNPTTSVGDYDLTASLTVDGQSYSDREQIKYVPYRFSIEPQYVIAGKNNKLTIDVQACSTDDELLVLNGYTGSPTASYVYNQPNTTPLNNDLDFSANLSDTNRQADLTFKESGHISITIEDQGFVCDEDRCPVAGGTLKGQFDVYARPWKIAICEVTELSDSSNQNPATTTGEPGFMPSGDDFSVTYIPIVHGDSKGSATEECDYPQTENYGLDNGPLEVTYSVSYPTTSPVIGKLTPDVIPAFDSSHRSRELTHSWSEVGTIELMTGATYLTMDLDADQQEIGRFYPKFFTVVNDTVWDYPDTQTFAYMNQPFNGVSFDIEALNAQGEALQNYPRFDSSLTARFALFEPDFTERFNSPTPNKIWQLSSQRSIGTFTLDRSSPSTECDSELCWEKAPAAEGYQDGPFNSTNGTASSISITDTGLSNADPVDYQDSAEGENDPRVLTTQPDIRFGRIELDSVGGTVNSALAIPLQAQFWDGSRFVTNADDSVTNVSGSNVVTDNRDIWLEADAVAYAVPLSGDAQLGSGQSRDIRATHASDVRQQTQVWLELDNDSNELPWLRYRWQDANRIEVNGEQDPSSVVTFGIYRGNDRVIFRGELDLNQQ